MCLKCRETYWICFEDVVVQNDMGFVTVDVAVIIVIVSQTYVIRA